MKFIAKNRCVRCYHHAKPHNACACAFLAMLAYLCVGYVQRLKSTPMVFIARANFFSPISLFVFDENIHVIRITSTSETMKSSGKYSINNESLNIEAFTRMLTNLC